MVSYSHIPKKSTTYVFTHNLTSVGNTTGFVIFQGRMMYCDSQTSLQSELSNRKMNANDLIYQGGELQAQTEKK